MLRVAIACLHTELADIVPTHTWHNLQLFQNPSGKKKFNENAASVANATSLSNNSWLYRLSKQRNTPPDDLPEYEYCDGGAVVVYPGEVYCRFRADSEPCTHATPFASTSKDMV